jgi:hypothetical protein
MYIVKVAHLLMFYICDVQIYFLTIIKIIITCELGPYVQICLLGQTG